VLSGAEGAVSADTGPLVPAGTEGVPEWLAGLEETAPDASDDETTDWLSALEEGAPVEGGQPEAAGPVETTVADAESLVPDSTEDAPEWLAGLEDGASTEAEPASTAAEGLPDWLMGLEEGAPTGVDMGAPSPEAESPEVVPTAEMPDSTSKVPAESQAPADELAEVDDGGPIQDVPSATEEAVPDWLVALEQEEPEEKEAVAAVDSGEGVPDWLVGGDAGETDDTGDARIPEWLMGIEEVGAGDAEPATGVEAVPEGDDAAPAWLETVGEIQSESASPADKGVTAWLQDVQDSVVPDAEPVGKEAPSEPSEAPALGESVLDTPSWMQDLYAADDEPSGGQDDLALSLKEELPASETPAWVDELRDKPVEPPEKVLPVETSGPLAGLRGVLNPEPLLAILPKSTYRPMPPITEADQAGIELVKQVLSAPVSRPTRSRRSAGREIMASLGRWILYLALVVMILLSPLQTWVRAPEQRETKSFFNTVEGVLPGSVVLVVVDYDASLDGELTPQMRAILWHLLHRNLGVVTVSLTPQGVAIVQDLLDESPSAVAGEHYVNLGYIPAHPAALQAFMNNPLGGATISGATQDPVHTSLAQRFQQFEELDLIVTVSGDQDHVRWWIEQVGSQTEIDILASVPLGVVPYIQPYYSETGRGQLKGMLAGLGATARYEELSDAGFAPSAQLNYIVQANAQMLLLLVVLVSGIGSLVIRPRGKRMSNGPVSGTAIGGDG
jgi:hypothetical protein